MSEILSAMETEWPIDSNAATPDLKTSAKELGRRIVRKTSTQAAGPDILSDDIDDEDFPVVTGDINPVLGTGGTEGAEPGTKTESRLMAGRKKKAAQSTSKQASDRRVVPGSESGGEVAGAKDKRNLRREGDEDEANASEIDGIV